MTTKCLIIDFSDCSYAVKELTDEQIANSDAQIIRFNDGQFEENLASIKTIDINETIEVKLLWTLVEATNRERADKIISFFPESAK